MKVNVTIGRFLKPCTIVNGGVCKDCHAAITWATMPNGKFIPLEPEEPEPGIMEAHFRYCTRREHHRPPHQPPAPPVCVGVQMDQTTWRHLLRLVHPDKHHGGDDEHLANELTRWLLEQRSRLTKS